MTEFLTTQYGKRLGYAFTPGSQPTVGFLGGFRSDMCGTKAIYLQDWAKSRGQAFLRLDYSGHGVSSGDFLDGTIGAWANDAQTVIEAVVDGPVILVGSSMVVG